MTPGETIALTRWTFAGKVMSLLFNMLSRLVIASLLRSKYVVVKNKQTNKEEKLSSKIRGYTMQRN